MYQLPKIKSYVPKEYDKYEDVNRLILIGNGFDLAHGLKSSFKDFIFDYCFQVLKRLFSNLEYKDLFIKLNFIRASELFDETEFNLTLENAFYKFNEVINNKNIGVQWKSAFFKRVLFDVEKFNWVDIELIYFHFLKQDYTLNNKESLDQLNLQLNFLKKLFLEYLQNQLNFHTYIVSQEILDQFQQHIKISDVIPETLKGKKKPKNYCILNFNYTNIAEKYSNEFHSQYIPIHGELNSENSTKQAPVFGYGDELDRDYIKFESHKDESVFEHIKSFKYLQYNHYRNLIEFIESKPFQVQIFGHSCGLSDRTLLNTIFENENCISIKTFYYRWGEYGEFDDFEQKSYAISRHFKSKSDLRIKVVNKERCETMFQPNLKNNNQ
ncbi:MAG: AbiH family protein [Sediminibacterium sp.]